MSFALRKIDTSPVGYSPPETEPVRSLNSLQLERFLPGRQQNVPAITAQQLLDAHDAGFEAGKEAGISAQMKQLCDALLAAVQDQDLMLAQQREETQNLRHEMAELIKVIVKALSETCGQEKLTELLSEYITVNISDVQDTLIINCPTEMHGKVRKACESIGAKSAQIRSAETVFLERGRETIRFDLNAMTGNLLALINGHFQGET